MIISLFVIAFFYFIVILHTHITYSIKF